MIQCADELFGVTSLEEYLNYLEANRDRLGVAVIPRPVGDAPESGTAWARVDTARWIADCPWRCGASHSVPRAETRFWCTACANNASGKTCELRWPDARQRIEVNLGTLPSMLASWPCAEDIPRYEQGRHAEMCEPCRTIGALQ